MTDEPKPAEEVKEPEELTDEEAELIAGGDPPGTSSSQDIPPDPWMTNY